MINSAVNSIPQAKRYQVRSTPRIIDLKMSSIRSVSAHPDGKRIAFASGLDGGREVWALENWVPPAKDKSK